MFRPTAVVLIVLGCMSIHPKLFRVGSGAFVLWDRLVPQRKFHTHEPNNTKPLLNTTQHPYTYLGTKSETEGLDSFCRAKIPRSGFARQQVQFENNGIFARTRLGSNVRSLGGLHVANRLLVRTHSHRLCGEVEITKHIFSQVQFYPTAIFVGSGKFFSWVTRILYKARGSREPRVCTILICFLISIFCMTVPGGAGAGDGSTYRVPLCGGPHMNRSYACRNYPNDLTMWLMLTDLQPYQQVAAIILRLEGMARELARFSTPVE